MSHWSSAPAGPGLCPYRRDPGNRGAGLRDRLHRRLLHGRGGRGIYAAGKLDEYREWTESLDYLDVLRLLDVSFRLGAIRGEKVFGRIREIVGDIDIEDLAIPYTAVATDLTNQQEIWFQEGCLHQAMRASAAIPSLFTPVMQGSRMLVDGGLLNPLPIVPVVSSHCDLIIAVNLNSTNQKQYQLPVIERPPAFKGRIDQMMTSLGERLPFRKRGVEEELLLEGATAPIANPWVEDAAAPGAQQPAAAPQKEGAPSSASGSQVVASVGPASLLDLVNQSFEVMQTSLAQYKIAGYPPDVLINVPKRVPLLRVLQGAGADPAGPPDRPRHLGEVRAGLNQKIDQSMRSESFSSAAMPATELPDALSSGDHTQTVKRPGTTATMPPPPRSCRAARPGRRSCRPRRTGRWWPSAR